MANEKDPITPIFCVFHQKTECSCIHPVTETKTLIERLKHHIKLNEILNRNEIDEAKKEKRGHESVVYENRLSDLKE